MAGLNAGICAFGALFPKGRWSTEEVVRFLSAAGPDVHNTLDREVPLLFSVRDLPSDRLGDCLAPAWRCHAHEHMFGIRVVALAEKMETACSKCAGHMCPKVGMAARKIRAPRAKKRAQNEPALRDQNELVFRAPPILL